MSQHPKTGSKIRQEIVTTNINEETGELLGQSKKIRRFNPKFNSKRGYLWWNKKGGVKSFHAIPFPKDMSMLDRGRVATLTKYIWGDTNCLGYRGHGGFRAYDIEGIGEIIGLNEKRATQFLKRMDKLKIIKAIPVKFGERVETQYYVNPLYYFSSRYLSSNLYTLFHEELESFIPEWVKAEFAKTGREEQAN